MARSIQDMQLPVTANGQGDKENGDASHEEDLPRWKFLVTSIFKTPQRVPVRFLNLNKAGFFLDVRKKTQGEKNSKLKEKTQNSSLKPKKSALFSIFLTFLCEKLQVL